MRGSTAPQRNCHDSAADPSSKFTDRIDDFGFQYLSFENRKPLAGQGYEAATGDRELCIVVLGGVCSVTSSAGDFLSIGKRRNVFDGKPYALYLPISTTFRVTADTDCDLAFCYSKAESATRQSW